MSLIDELEGGAEEEEENARAAAGEIGRPLVRFEHTRSRARSERLAAILGVELNRVCTSTVQCLILINN